MVVVASIDAASLGIGGPTMTTYLINHMRIPNGIPKPEGLVYLEKVEATFKPYGGKWLVLDEPTTSSAT
jgi:uncharacterized protein (DUF1330 family)